MGPEGHPAHGGPGHAGQQVLFQEPDAHHEDRPGRDGENGKDYKEELKPHFPPGEHHHVEGADARDGPGRPDHGNGGMGGHGVLQVGRAEAAQQVSDQIGELSHPVFHLVPEHIKKVHIAQDVGEARVKEHGGKDVPEMGMGRDETHAPDQPLEIGPKNGLEENIEVHTDQ